MRIDGVHRLGTALCISLLVPVIGCARDPGEAARSFLASGDGYVARGEWQAAALEYRNAIEYQPELAEAHYKLGTVYMRLGEGAKASEAFTRTTALTSTYPDADLHVAAASLDGRRFEQAQRLSARVLAVTPDNQRALVIAAKALDGMGRRSAAEGQLHEALRVNPRSADAHLLQAAWMLRDGEPGNARRAYMRAVEYEPQSADAWAALGQFHWSTGELQEAEDALGKAADLTPGDALPRRLLAAFYLTTGRADEAEVHMRHLSRGGGPGETLALADYYLAVGKGEAAEAVLAELAAHQQFAPEVHLRRAALAHARGDVTAAGREVAAAVKHATTEPRARLLESRWLLDARDLDGALEQAQRAAALAPRWPEAGYAVGVVRMARGELDEAVRSFKRVRDLTPEDDPFVDAQLARIELARGNVSEAINYAEAAFGAAPSPAIAALLARTRRVAGDMAGTRKALADALARWPADAALETERGFLELASSRPRIARDAFERALRSRPSAPDTRYGLVASQVADKRPGDAWAAIAAWQEASPDDVQLAILSARLALEEGNARAAERTLEQLVGRVPNDPDAAEALAQLYAATGRIDKAATAYDRVTQLRPRAVGALTMVGMLRQQLGDAQGARSAYERALAVDAAAGIAANNLAWLQLDTGELDAAVQSARQAERALQGAPEALDTLGWALHSNGRHNEAIRHLTSARDKAPEKPIYHYHLGVALAAASRDAESRAALQEALRLSAAFPGADDAQRRLATGNTAPPPSDQRP